MRFISGGSSSRRFGRRRRRSGNGRTKIVLVRKARR
jgi:hypothetical protein